MIVLLGVALLGAAVSPWYISVWTIDNKGDTAATTLLFYWHGVFLHATDGKSHTFSKQVSYADFDGDKLSEIYIVCNVMGILAFCMTAGAPIAIYLLLYRETGRMSFSMRKVIVGFYFGAILIFVILSWAIFFAWPGALNKSLLCTDPQAAEKGMCFFF